ncbi:MAG: TIGR01777 family oxidoreductase [Thermodesulfovibrionales bacterium]|nr:TIGR01777 family oxidoreductase [Thermodesulfovibrionales bacterium]
MRIVMSGATGFIGSNLTKAFNEKGWIVIPLLVDDFKASNSSLSTKLNGADVVINLAGAPVVAKWTEEYKKVLFDSRVKVTSQIVETLKNNDIKPRVFISTSAVGIYDSRDIYSEDNASYANDFLGNLAIQWEKAALNAEELGIRTIIFRFGIVLGKDGGILATMLPYFKVGLGGTIGNGKQGFSWVHIEDLKRAYIEAILNEKYRGIYNLTAPNPTTNEGLTKAISKSLGIPALFRIPLFALKLKYGEGAIAIASGQRVIPKRLLELGFKFKFVEINEAIKDVLS